jgi:hypothetical protein
LWTGGRAAGRLVGAPCRRRRRAVFRVDRRVLLVVLALFAAWVFGVLLAGKRDPFAPPRPTTLLPAEEAPAAPAAPEGGRR